MKLTEKTKAAKKFGQEAQELGEQRIAALDSNLQKLIADLPVGGGAAKILMAWYAGYDLANLA